MEKPKETTKQMLAESLKGLMLSNMPFDKITIRDITDRAGLIRPTFYHHFQDKYELLEWIFHRDIMEPSYVLLDNHMVEEAFKIVLIRIEKEGDFFRKAYKVEGQNSFESIVFSQFYQWCLHYVNLHRKASHAEQSWPSPEDLSKYYANSMVFLIVTWIASDFPVSANEMDSVCTYLATHSLKDLLLEKAP